MFSSFTEWLRRLVRDTVREELAANPNSIPIHYKDPLALTDDQRAQMKADLERACNFCGKDVFVGRDVVLWGGRHPSQLGLELHDHVRLFDQCRLVIDQLGADSGIRLEAGVALNFGCYLDGSGGVRIGKGTILGPNVVIVSSGHVVDPTVPLSGSGKHRAKVDIGDNVWIGANTAIRMGVTIGNDAVIGAGSVVTRDIPARAIAFGNPARVASDKPQPDAPRSPIEG